LDLHPASGAAVAVEADAGSGAVVVQRALLRPPRGAGAGAAGLQVRTGGTADLQMRVRGTVLGDLGAGGIAARAAGDSRLLLALTGNGFLGEPAGAEAVSVHAGGRADVHVEAVGNDLLARDVGLLLTADGDASLLAEVADNAVLQVPRGRGMAVLTGGRSASSVRLSRNRLGGQRAEALYVLAAAGSRLGVELRDNRIAGPAALASPPTPALLLQAHDEAMLCLEVGANQVGDPPGGAPAAAIRQRGGGEISLAGTGAASAVELLERHLSGGVHGGRVELSLERPLAAAGGPRCPSTSPPRVATGG
jgi:hypothetical protein